MKFTFFSQKVLPLFIFILTSLSLTAEVSYQDVLIAEEFPVGNMLAWSTAFEEGSQFFFIEKSSDGVYFENIGQLEAAGDSNEGKKYHFLDVGVQSEKVLYRLKQTDLDGTVSFSDVITMHKTLTNNFMVVRMNKTDVVSSFECSIDNTKAGIMTYELKNLRGDIIETKDVDLVAGLNDLIIDTEDLKSGIYKVNLKMNAEEETLVIQRVMTTESKPALRASKQETGKGG
jgi:hypothetical protein